MEEKSEGLVRFEEGEIIFISKKSFFDGMTLPVSIYLNVSKTSYIRIGKSGEKAHFSKIKGFVKDESQIGVTKAEHGIFLQYLSTLTTQILNNKNVPHEIKVQFLGSLTQEVLATLASTNIADYQQLNRVSKLILGFSDSVEGFASVVNILAGMTGIEAHHAVAVSMISLLLCEEMDIKQASVLEKISFGALVHDIGMRTVPPHILEKPKYDWTHEEIKLFENHPFVGVEMIRDMKEVSNDVLLMIMEHHENSIGTGFPKKLREVKISPMGKILILADFLADLLYGRIEKSKKFTAESAIEYIENILGQPFSKPAFKAFKNIVYKTYLKKKAGLS